MAGASKLQDLLARSLLPVY
ncbi:hypothetical protein HU200_062275 [Digitaria exilis]|uniref:Uncharacterized protein n=1 Tax=Digitaria exilis TaxID=1010633 RepID=A0A835AG13_9POAL|nr:hypothetical protein HU200_062275 [Digitaria exilis]